MTELIKHIDKYPSIVLTATIIPNAIRTEYTDTSSRRAEYLKAIEFYKKYGRIYFLENSTYDLMSDKDFFKYENVHIRKFPPSKYYIKGKGYQEFEMLDSWLTREIPAPSRWIKISGRYLVSDFDKIFAECLNENNYSLIIEQKKPPSRIAYTDIFYITSEFYRSRFLGAYKDSDDVINVYIEHVIRERLRNPDEYRLFREMPLITGISGSTRGTFSITLKKRLKRVIGNLLYRFNQKYRIF